MRLIRRKYSIMIVLVNFDQGSYNTRVMLQFHEITWSSPTCLDMVLLARKPTCMGRSYCCNSVGTN